MNIFLIRTFNTRKISSSGIFIVGSHNLPKSRGENLDEEKYTRQCGFFFLLAYVFLVIWCFRGMAFLSWIHLCSMNRKWKIEAEEGDIKWFLFSCCCCIFFLLLMNTNNKLSAASIPTDEANALKVPLHWLFQRLPITSTIFHLPVCHFFFFRIYWLMRWSNTVATTITVIICACAWARVFFPSSFSLFFYKKREEITVYMKQFVVEKLFTWKPHVEFSN